MVKYYGKTAISLSSSEGLIALLGSERALQVWMRVNAYIYKRETDEAPLDADDLPYYVIRPEGEADGFPELRVHKNMRILSSKDTEDLRWRYYD